MARALVRAASALCRRLPSYGLLVEAGVGASADAARTSARATFLLTGMAPPFAESLPTKQP